MTDLDAYNVLQSARKMNKIHGEYAEVGVYQGGSAILICGSTERTVHLFDTFEGLPETNEADTSTNFYKGAYSASLNEVRRNISAQNVKFYPRLFPQSAPKELEDAKFAFVHLDVDIYTSTIESLRYFYPRMNRGGVIMSHDYDESGNGGVGKAFNEFFRDKSEIVIPLGFSTECMVIKL